MSYSLEKNPLFKNISVIEEKSGEVTVETADALLKEIDFSFKEVLKKRKRADSTDIEKQDFFSDIQVRLVSALGRISNRLPEKAESVVNHIKNMNLLYQNTDDALFLRTIVESYSKISMSGKQAVEVMQALIKTKNIKLHPHLVLKLINDQILPTIQQQEDKQLLVFSDEKGKSSFLMQVKSFLEKRLSLQIKVANKPIVLGILDKMKGLQGCSKDAEYPLEHQLHGKEKFCVIGSNKGPVTHYVNGNVITAENGMNIIITPDGNTFIRESATHSRKHSYPHPVAERKKAR